MNAVALVFTRPQPYAPVASLQAALQQARMEERIPDVVLLLEHTPTVTLGRRGRDHFLKLSRADYARRGMALEIAMRGGDVTCHGPGQWVLYPHLRLDRRASGARGYLYRLEDIALLTAADFGVRAYRRAGMNGAWSSAGKLAAIGFHVRRGVTSHGMSFNVHPDLGAFDLIVPCGLEGQKVASLHTHLGPATPAPQKVGDRLLYHFSRVCGRRLDRLCAPAIDARAPVDWPLPLQEVWNTARVAAGPAEGTLS